MKYYIGKWKLENGVYSPPDGMEAGVDLRSIGDMSNTNQDGYGLFLGNGNLGSDYDLLGNGDIREIKSTGRLRNMFQRLLGYKPQGDNLSDLLFDILTIGSHPDGAAGVRSLVPSTTSTLMVKLHGHGTIKTEKFNRQHRHWNKTRDVLRETYRIAKTQSKGDEHRKLLTMLGIKFGISDPENHFIPKDLPKERPLPPDTTFTETFPTDGATLDSGSQDLTWDTDVSADMDVSGNQLVWTSARDGEEHYAEAQHDLSDDDMSTSIDIITMDIFTGGSNDNSPRVSALVRVDNSTTDNYYKYEKFIERDSDTFFKVRKYVGGTGTTLVGSTALTGSLLGTMTLSMTGSTLTYDSEGSTVDTSIIGNVRGGFYVETDNGGSVTPGSIVIDNIVITDGVSDPVPDPVRDIPLQTTTGCFGMSTFVGSQSIAIPFEPKVLIFYSNRNMENSGDYSLQGLAEANANLSMGWALGSGAGEYGVYPQCAVSQFTAHDREDRQLTGSCRSHTPSGCFIMAGEANATHPGDNTFGNIASAYLTQMGTTTKLQWDQVDGIPREICYFAIGGSELNQFNISQIEVPYDSGVVDYTGLGFEPGLLMSLSAGIESSIRVAPEADSAMGIGWAVGSGLGKQYAHGHWCKHVPQGNFLTNHTHGNQSNKHLIAFNNDYPNDADPVTDIFEVSAAFSGVHSDGFKLNWDGIQGSGATVFVMALEGNLYNVGTFSSPDATSPTYPITYEQTVEGMGFRPLSVFVTGHGRDGFTNRGGTTGSFHSFGVANEDVDFDVRDSPTCHMLRQNVGLQSPNVAVTTTTKGDVIIDTVGSDITLERKRIARLDSFTNDGMQLTWDLYNGVAADYGYLVFGSKFSIGDMDCKIVGALASGVSNNFTGSIKSSTFPGQFNFYTGGLGGDFGLGTAGNINFSTTPHSGIDSLLDSDDPIYFNTVARVPENSGLAMNTLGIVGTSTTQNMYTVGPIPVPVTIEDGTMGMYMHVNDLVTHSGDLNVFMWSTTNPGLRGLKPMYLKNTNYGPFASMNMYVPNAETDDVTSNMNMYINTGDNPDGSSDINNNITFMVGSSGAIETTTFFTKGLGTTDGSLPYNGSMNMVIYSQTAQGDMGFYMPGPSGENQSFNMYMPGQASNSGVPFYIDSSDTKSNTNKFFTRGF